MLSSFRGRIMRPNSPLLLLAVLGCGSRDRPANQQEGRERQSAAAGSDLTCAGATFPNPIYTKWFDAYAKETGVRINYQSIGSGGGIRQFTEVAYPTLSLHSRENLFR